MHINDVGNWCMVWLCVGSGKTSTLTHAFFYHKEQALTFRDRSGGELYLRDANGTLKRV